MLLKHKQKKNQKITALLLLGVAIASQHFVNSSVTSSADPDFFSLHTTSIVWMSFGLIGISSILFIFAYTFNWRQKISSKFRQYLVVLTFAAVLSAILIIICTAFNLGGVNINF
jgi:heme/copper-type cytochrome/quinol oxidase subunit 2